MLNKKCRFYSFDVFDTCLARTCGTPSNFFDILSTRVFTKAVHENVRLAFIVARQEAEDKSTKSNIYNIYDSFSFNHPDILPNNEILNNELQLEREVIVPILETKQKIDRLRDRENRIIFISDMYLPPEFIQERLEAFDIFKKGDKLYVSGEIGHNKYGLELYKYIHIDEKIPYNKWHHTGDNYICDYKRPKKLGIKTSHVEHDYSFFQLSWKNTSGNSTYKTADIVAGISRAFNISLPDHPRKLLITDVVAPLYCSFICHIFEEASMRGIKKLFFCARDTYQLFQTAKVITKRYPNIEISYLRVSRRALLEENTPNILGYFEQEGLASKDYNAAIVDTGSNGRTHYLINKILTDNGYNPVFGYFIKKNSISEHPVNYQLLDSCLNRRYIQYDRKYNNLFKKHSLDLILEDIFSTNTDKKTIGYHREKDKYIPLYLDVMDDENTIQKDHYNLQTYTTDLLQRYAKKFINFGLYRYANYILYQIAIPTLISFINKPTKEYTRSLLTCKQLLYGECLPIVKKESFFRLIRTKGRDTTWNRATLYYSLPNWMAPLLDRIIEKREKKM